MIMDLSCQLHFIPKKELTIINLKAKVTFSNIKDELKTFGKKTPTLYELCDSRNLSGDRLSTDDVHKIIIYFNNFDIRPPENKTGVVVYKDMDYGLKRILSILVDQDGCHTRSKSLVKWITPING